MARAGDIEQLLELGRPASPEDAKAARLGRMVALRQPMTWPGGQLELVMKVLSSTEHEDARLAGWEDVKKRGIDPAKLDAQSIELTSSQVVRQILQRALLDPMTGRPYFESCAEFQAIATEDEIDALFHRYSDLRRLADPDLRAITEEEFTEIDEAVKKKDATRLRDIASGMPRRSLLSMVGRLATSLTASSSSTSDASRPSPSPTERETTTEATGVQE